MSTAQAVSPHLALVGPTASGKSSLAIALARAARATGRRVELVSVDSMAVYRGMDIGTAKPSPEDRWEIPHHLLDVADPDEEYSVARFQADARLVLRDIEARGALAVLVGGTGLYVDAVVDDLTMPGRFPEARATVEGRPVGELHELLATLDPVAASRMEPTNERRIVRALEVTIGTGKPFSSFGPGLQQTRTDRPRFVLVGLRLPREVVAERITLRYSQQMADGFLDEVKALNDRFGDRLSRTAKQALGYRELLAHLKGECSLDEAIEQARVRTVKFAKRQERWFRRDDRIDWIDIERDAANSPEIVTPLLARWITDQRNLEST